MSVMVTDPSIQYTPTKYYGYEVYYPEYTMRGWQVFKGPCLGKDRALGMYVILRGNNSTVVAYVNEVFETRRDAWASIADKEPIPN